MLSRSLTVGCHAMDIGAMTLVMWAFEERGKNMEFYECVSGAWIHAAYFRPGGLQVDIQKGILHDIYIFIEQFTLHKVDVGIIGSIL